MSVRQRPKESQMEEINLSNRDVSIVPTVAVSSKMMDANAYATKKTVAQGMLDIALLTANASQLKYVLQVGEKHEFYTLMITMISISIILQVIIGIGFLFIGGISINVPGQQKTANLLNNLLTGCIFIVTVLNVMISSFGMKQSDDEALKETGTS